MTRRFDHVWYWGICKGKYPIGERKDERCRVIARGKKNSVLVEFEDGHRVVTSRWAVRGVENKDG